VLTAAQVNRLLDGTRDDGSGALWAALATTGLRLREALGLKWSDLDRAELRVQRSLRPAVAGDGGVQVPLAADAQAARGTQGPAP
jgi:integrase